MTQNKIKRIWHPWQAWECYRAGFFKAAPKEDLAKYAAFFRVPGLFEESLKRVFKEWPNSCEHNLTSPSLNKVAWCGQASACLAWGLSAENRSGYNLLSEEEQRENNTLAEKYLTLWYEEHGYEPFKTI